MLYALVASALVAAVSAQGEPNPIYPDGVNSPPPNSNFPKDAFILSTVPLNAPSDTSSIYNCTGITPKITLTGSALTDSNGSTGSIVANDQFQFDGPPQAGVKVSAGWYRNKNSTLSLGTAGDSAVFYNCLSGSFSNIYRTSIGAQCVPVFLALQLCTADTSCGANYTTIKKDGTPQFQIPKVNTDDSLLAPTSYFDASSCTPGATTSAASSSSATSTVSSISSAATTLTTSAAAAPTTVPTTSTPMMVPTQIQPMMTAAAAPAPAPVSGSNATVASATPSTSAPVAFKSGNAAPVVIAGGKVGAVLAVVAGAFALA